jgi:predicted DNA-binding transcriptional regulator AlpA
MQFDIIDTDELARRTGTSATIWAKRRMQGGDTTPPYLKLGRSVRYSWADVQAWLDAQKRQSTSEAA